MRVLVTGGAGFIGANLSKHLVERGHEVVVLDDLSTGTRRNLVDVPVLLVEGTILSEADLDRAMDGVDVVVHLAARPSVPRSVHDPMASHRVNVTGTGEVLEAVRRAGDARDRPPQVIVASSSSVYGANPTLPKHEDLAPRPLSPYAATKLATESYALAWSATFGLEVLAVRFFNVFGPLQAAGHAYAAVVPAFVEAALAGRPLPVHGDGTQSRDFTYVGSACAVLCDAIARRVSDSAPVNLAFGSRVSLLEVVSELEAILGARLELEHQPTRPGDVAHSQADTVRLRSLFPDVEPVPLVAGLAATVDWFRSSPGGGSAREEPSG